MTKQDVIESVFTIASDMQLNGYITIIHTTTLPELTKMIIYEMFINNFESSDSMMDYNIRKSVECLRNYSIELKAKGFVEFN